jgi:hypothetical protein
MLKLNKNPKQVIEVEKPDGTIIRLELISRSMKDQKSYQANLGRLQRELDKYSDPSTWTDKKNPSMLVEEMMSLSIANYSPADMADLDYDHVISIISEISRVLKEGVNTIEDKKKDS